MRTVDRFDNLNKALDLVAQAGAQRNLIAAGKALQGVPHRSVDINIVNAVPAVTQDDRVHPRKPRDVRELAGRRAFANIEQQSRAAGFEEETGWPLAPDP
ncbi:MAG: hypothetical protein WB774_14870 [Xanthobacteraceae bacterium]